ncbi:MAG: cytochrome c oxidase assembly protein [Betaproteobacteria bacterium RIFCSPLOWO2_12_FULL_62_58]|nr:MAG: cytochrome c oxidase assembly protein [Betaproteobacteria bacterium RIFCSPLOWO2_02_FULL_62_79]OGA48016.1 MAG: cytochrome c oxidase assembly protein [Betaproteobacteria bacterium RIFCSPLOWO2_12_FULL_62_58]
MVANTQFSANNLVTLKKLLIVACAMFGFGFALVPFYKKICEVTGVNNVLKADAVTNSQVDTARFLTVEFDTNLRNDLPWTFTPLEKSVRFHPGELIQVVFEVRNNSNRPVTGQAIPSYGPQLAARYFKKLDCFCFTQQTLAPGEVRRMPVVFVIEKGLPREVNTVTLSYTFFEVEGTAKKAS